MKKFKITRGIQIILLTLLVLTIGAIAVGITGNSKVAAATKKCPYYLDQDKTIPCGGTWTIVNHSGTSHTWECASCTGRTTEACSGGSWIHKSGITKDVHQKFCWACGYFYDQEDCYDDDGDGVCDACGYDGLHTHSYDDVDYEPLNSDLHSITRRCSCGDTKSGGTESHSFGSPTNNGGTHSRTCSKCGYDKTESHSFGSWGDNGDGQHIRSCSCGASETEAHSYGEWTDNGDGNHKRSCTCGAEETEEHAYGEYINNEDGTHTRICSVCEAEETGDHVYGEWTDNEDGTHTRTCECGAEETEDHIYGEWTDNEDGTHIRTCECGAEETEEHTFEEYTDNGDGTHTGTCKCGAEDTQDHSGATHENEGKCEICDAQYELHEKSEEIKEYKKKETGHKPIYKCIHDGCTETYNGEEEAHNFEEGICTVCGYEEYQEVDITSEEYEIDEEYISKVQPETTVGEFKEELKTNATEVNIYNKDNELVKDDENVGTGMKVQFKLGNATKEYTIIVRGDVDGDGSIKMSDLSIVNRYRLGKRELEEMYLRAGNVTDDGKVDFKDLTKINRFRLSKITEL